MRPATRTTRCVATVLSLEGSQDAIRFGDLAFSGRGLPRRRFQVDLLTGRFRIFAFHRDGRCEVREDDNLARRAAAGRAIQAALNSGLITVDERGGDNAPDSRSPDLASEQHGA